MEIIERLTTLKEFIEKHNISIYEKKGSSIIQKIFDCMDNNNTVTVVVYKNNTVKIEGEESLLKESIISILEKRHIATGDMDYFHQLQKGG